MFHWNPGITPNCQPRFQQVSPILPGYLGGPWQFAPLRPELPCSCPRLRLDRDLKRLKAFVAGKVDLGQHSSFFHAFGYHFLSWCRGSYPLRWHGRHCIGRSRNRMHTAVDSWHWVGKPVAEGLRAAHQQLLPPTLCQRHLHPGVTTLDQDKSQVPNWCLARPVNHKPESPKDSGTSFGGAVPYKSL